MGKTYKDIKIRVEGKKREVPDARKLARVVIELAQAQEAAAEAEAVHGVRMRVKPAKKERKERPPSTHREERS